MEHKDYCYTYGMPRNIVTNDLRNYQLDNPATPEEFA